LLIELPMFIMRLSASGRSYPRVYLNEAQEVFLDGHVQAFEHFGGVPERIRYDNLKAAVVRVLKGRGRVESERFVALRSHYGFDSFFCQPGIVGSHEKGGVEGEVGRFRRRHLVPVPRVASLAELNEMLVVAAARDDQRFIAHRRITVGEHFALEAPTLRTLPGEAFDVSVVATHRVDRKSRVSVRGCLYSVPARYVGRRVDVRDGTRALIEVLLLHRSLPSDALIAGIDAALAVGSVDAEVVAVEARRRGERTGGALVIPIGEGLSRFDRPPPSIARYDDLLEAT
jgi:hypothetical protein